MSPVTDSGVNLFRCTRCPYQMWDALPEDIADHYDAFHPDPAQGIRVVHDHGPGPSLDCQWCRAALDEYDRMGRAAGRSALAAGTHRPAVDDFGNQYLAPRGDDDA